jgi:hypothetical protein
MKGIPVTEKGDPLRVTRVLAGSYSQFDNWCRFSRVNPRSGMVKYVHRVDSIRGLRDFDLVYTGTWFDRPEREIVPIQHAIDYFNFRGGIKKVYSQYESADIEPNVVEGE